MRPEDRERIQVEVVSRVLEDYTRRARQQGGDLLERVVHDTIYHERRRLETEPKDKAAAERPFYDELQRAAKGASQEALRALVERLARHFVEEIVGNFDPRVYRLTTRVVPGGLAVLLGASSPHKVLSMGLAGLLKGVEDNLSIEGPIEHIRRLATLGTLVVVPTHSSNLDSIVLGYAAYLIGLPPLTYGAGLNLFTNPVISFFMRNLGAYRVDRKKKAPLYKDVLKTYATCSIEMGYHNLFFPGGTRSRSGAVEQRLKKGLLGTGLAAYIGNLRAGREHPKVFVVPCTLSSKLVLEASTLIDDHLKAEGKSRYIIDDDEFSRPKALFDFVSKLFSLDSKITLRFARPMDVFGNPVDDRGESLDARGRVIDASRYVTRDGVPVYDEQRDQEYTRELADEVARAYLRENVVLSTNVSARAMFELLREANPHMDLYRLLRTGGDSPSFRLQELYDRITELLGHLERLPKERRPRLSQLVSRRDPSAIVDDALRHFGSYHKAPAMVRRGDRVFHQDRNLLLYYGNRLEGYGLDNRRRSR